MRCVYQQWLLWISVLNDLENYCPVILRYLDRLLFISFMMENISKLLQHIYRPFHSCRILIWSHYGKQKKYVYIKLYYGKYEFKIKYYENETLCCRRLLDRFSSPVPSLPYSLWSVFSTMVLNSHLLPLYYSLSSSNRNAEYMNTQTFHWKKCTHLLQNFDRNTCTNLLRNATRRSLKFGFGLRINVTIWTTALLLPLPPNMNTVLYSSQLCEDNCTHALSHPDISYTNWD